MPAPVRSGSCRRCGECCKTGDPFAPRTPRGARLRPCSYYREQDGVGECMAWGRDDAPEEVRRYLALACYPFPSEPSQTVAYPSCGFRWS